MTWTKLDDAFWSNPKVMAVGNEAVGAFCRMLSYCGDHLTDGTVPVEAARAITRPTILTRLQEFSFLVENGTGYLIPDFLDFNPSREKVLEDRRKATERQAKLRGESRRDK